MGTLVISNLLGGFFVSPKTVRYPDGPGRNFEDMEQP